MNLSVARMEVFARMDALEPEPAHVRQVARLAGRLHVQLAPPHALFAKDAFLLEAAALLHDIGWTVARDGAGHHKHSARLIRESEWTGLDRMDIEVVALIARYHRRSLPKPEHADYMALPETERRRVGELAALLRVADGLDRRHLQKVRDVEAFVSPETVTVRVRSPESVAEELAAARKKADLAEHVFGRPWRFEADAA